MTEIWKDIEGYESLYQVSNLGRVKRGNRFLKFEIINKGYVRVGLCKDGKQTRFFVHRLVAQAFIPNPDNLPIINHKDHNPLNNCVDNIEWCDYYYNSTYDGARKMAVTTRRKNNNYVITDDTRQKMRNAKVGKHTPVSMKCSQYTKDGQYIDTYPSMREASLKTGVCHSSITQVCKGERKTAGGYRWRYAS